MSKRTLATRLILASVLLLFFTHGYAVLPYTMTDNVEYGNTPLHNVLKLSNGKYVSLMGFASRVFSLAGNAIVFEQSVPSPERYQNVLKGDGDILYAMSLYGTLDIFAYDPALGLHLLSSTDLSDPAGDVTMVDKRCLIALANGVLVCEAYVSTFNGDEWYIRMIVDVSDPGTPVLFSRVHTDFQNRYTGFYHLGGHYVYIGYNGSLYASDAPSPTPASVYVPGLDQLAIHSTALIDGKIYFVCSDADQVYRIARLDLTDFNAPVITMMHTTDTRILIDISEVSGNSVYVAGQNGAGIWCVEKYLYSDQDNWQLLASASFDNLFYTLFPIDDGYFAAGFYRSLILDGNLDQQYEINISSSYYLYMTILDRYLVLDESVDYGISSGFRIFDLQTEEWLDFQIDAYLDDAIVYGADKLAFHALYGAAVVVEFGQDGIERTWSVPTQPGISQLSVMGNMLAMSGYVNGQWRIFIYTLDDSGYQLRSETVVPHICARIYFYTPDHIFTDRITVDEETYFYFYRIEQDYSLTFLREIVSSGTASLIMENAIIQSIHGGSIIDTTDPDLPAVSYIVSLPSSAGWQTTFDGHGHYLFNDMLYSFLLDSNFGLRGHINGVNLRFYQQGCFLNPGPVSCVKARIDAISDNGDPYIPELPQTVKSYPNPFKSSATIEFSLLRDEVVTLEVFNCRGQKVADLSRQMYASGTHHLVWDGTDGQGNRLSSGIYLLRAKASGASFLHKMVLFN
jgi:hypothetical protein